MSRRRWNILYSTGHGNFFGGGQVSLFQLVTRLDGSIFHPRVLLPFNGTLVDKLKHAGIEVVIEDLPKISIPQLGRSIGSISRMIKIIERHKIDLIHTDNPRHTFYLGIVAKIKRVPLVWHVRASGRDKYDRLLYLLSDRLVLVANALKNRFHWVQGNSKLMTIYNGVDCEDYQGFTETNATRESLGVPADSLLITVIGRIEPLKGHMHLIEACGYAKDKIRNFYLLCVGDLADGDYLLKCRTMAEKYDLSDRIIFTGDRNDIAHILKSTDIFVLPSLFEACPRSILEAMAAGKPSIVTSVGGCPEAVEDMKSGMIIPPGKPDMLAEKIILLAEDASLRNRLGREARIRAERMFNMEQNVAQTENLYRQLLDGRGL